MVAAAVIRPVVGYNLDRGREFILLECGHKRPLNGAKPSATRKLLCFDCGADIARRSYAKGEPA